MLRPWLSFVILHESSEVKDIKKGIKNFAHRSMEGGGVMCLSVCLCVCPSEKGEKLLIE
jgi:hypothetical protein